MPAIIAVLLGGVDLNLAELAVVLGGSLAAGLIGLVAGRHRSRIHLSSRLALVLAIVLIAAWVGVVGTLAILRHEAFQTHAYDLGIFDQVLWNSSQGRWFANSIMADSPSFLGHHFSPLLLALVPLYWMGGGPTALLGAQAALLGLAGIPLFLISRRLLGEVLALVVLVAYLLYPATANIALFDFHEIVLAVPLLMLALAMLLCRRYLLFGLALALASLAKEDIGLIGAGLGLYVALAHRRRVIGFGIAVVSLAWTLFLIRFAIPHFHPSGQYVFNALYGDLGNDPLDILALARDPAASIGRLVEPGKLLYLQQLFAPVLAIPILGWPVLATAALTFGYLLIGRFPSDLIQYQYTAPLLPTIAVSTATGIAFIRERCKPYWPQLAPALGAALLASSIAGAYLYGELPLARSFSAEHYAVASRTASARALIATIPASASVIAQSDLVPQLSHRPVVQTFGLADANLWPDYYLFDVDSKASRWPLGYEDKPYFAALAHVTADAEYRIVAQRDGYWLVKREQPSWDQQLGVVFGSQIELVAYRIASDRITPGSQQKVELYWRAVNKPQADYSVFIHLLDGQGRRFGQRDTYPLGEAYPTSEWSPGRLLRGEYVLNVAPDAPVGLYQLLLGLYDLKTMQRLTSAMGNETVDSITVPGLEVRGD